MKCPVCGSEESKVKDSREVGDAIHRRRECLECHHRFSTYERVENERILIVKRDERREPFDRQKIYAGIRKACEKRPLPVGELEQLVDEIEEAVYRLGKREIPSQRIGELVMRKLRDLDPIAYIRFASVYKSYTDLEAMRQEMDELLSKSQESASKS